MIIRFLIFLMVFLPGLASIAQNKVLVLDAASSKPVPYANVRIDPLESGQKVLQTISSEDGVFEHSFSGLILLSVSHISYENYRDTIDAGDIQKILLKPVAINMDQVSVSAQILQRPRDKSIYKVDLIKRDLIQKKAANDLGELLKSETNIRIEQDASLGSKLSIQGLGGEHVKILVDGVPVNGRMDGNIDLGQLNLAQAEQVEVVQGPMSVIYGSNALAGAVNIITRRNALHKLEAGAQAYFESVGVYNANAWAALRNGNSHFRMSAGRNFFGGWDPMGDVRDQQWKPKRQILGDAHYTYRHSKINLNLSLSAFNEELRDKGKPVPPYEEEAFDSYYFTNRLRSSADIKYKINDIRSLKMLTAVSFYERRKESWYKDLVNLTEIPLSGEYDRDTTKFNDYTFRFLYNRGDTAQKLNYQLGLDFSYEEGNGKRILNNDQDIGDYALFLNLNYRPCPYFEIQPGLRIAYNSQYDAPLVYSFNTAWNIIDPLRLRLSYARGFRAPGLKELYLNFVDVNHNIIGNPDLKAENSVNIQGGLEYHTDKQRFMKRASLNFFYNDVDDLIHLGQLDDEVYTYINLDEFKSLGTNLKLNLQPFTDLSANIGGGITAQKSNSKTQNAADIDYLVSPEISASLDYNILKDRLMLAVFYKYNGKLPQYILNDNNEVERSELDDYQMMDISLNMPFWEKRVQLSCGVKNLFDVQDVSVSGAAGGGVHSSASSANPVGWGRSYFARLTFKVYKQ